MAKKRLTGYTFDASAKTIVHADFSDITLDGIQLIVNVTDNIIIYNFADATKGGTLATDTLTLTHDTTSMSDTDNLMILIDDGLQQTITAELSAVDNAVLDAIAASVAAIDTDATTIIGHLDGVETLLGTIDADTGNMVTALQLIDDAIYIDDADWTDDTSKHVLVGGLYQSTPQTVTDGDVAPFNITANGALHVAQQGNITADLGATDNAVLDAIAASVAAIDTDATTIIGHVDGIEALLTTIDADTGSILTAVQLIDDAIFVDDTATHSTGSTKVMGIGAVAVPTDTSISANDIGMVGMSTDRRLYTQDVGNIAHDSIDSGNPVKIGAKVETSPKGITVPADADRTDLYADSDGMMMMKLMTSGADLVTERVSNTDGASTAFSNFSAVASTFNYVYAYSIFRTDAGTTPIYVDFRDGTGGAIKWSVVIPPNGGANLASAAPLFKTSANTALAYDVSAATTTVYISLTGFQSKV